MKPVGILLAVSSGINLIAGQSGSDAGFNLKPKCDPHHVCNRDSKDNKFICGYSCECEQEGYRLESSSSYDTTEQLNGYTCVPCEPNFYGMNCANEHDDCKGDPCGVGQKKCETAHSMDIFEKSVTKLKI